MSGGRERAAKPIRVLVVDDSAIVRKVIEEELSRHPDIKVVGTAPDPFIARDKILRLSPDVLTLDIEMPRMDGITFLRKLMRHHPLPVIIVSSLSQSGSRLALAALESGAIDVMSKPGSSFSVGELSEQLAVKIRGAAAARLRSPEPPEAAPEPLFPRGILSVPPPGGADRVIAVAASTGGTEAIRDILTRLGPEVPGMVIVQHMPAQFTAAFASRLDSISKMEVKEAEDYDEVRTGRALIAPGNYHMVLERKGTSYRVRVRSGPLVCHQRPSGDVLFHSVAEAAGPHAAGIILTGMGKDGAGGLLRMKQKGAVTIAQDEESCVVFGMPREAVRIGAVDHVLPLGGITGFLQSLFRDSGARSSPGDASTGRA